MAESDELNAEEEKSSRDKIYDFLMEKYRSGDSFTKEELKSITEYTDVTFKTYFNKIVKYLCKKVDKSNYRVSDSFRKYTTKKKFDAFYSQSHSASEEYTRWIADNVIIYDFFMPLTNESELKAALDALFYKDTLKKKIKMINEKDLQTIIPMNENEEKNDYNERVCNEISKHFTGYSIGIYNGRYLADDIKTYQEVADSQESSLPYLIDETTAIVRFIFPVHWRKFNQRKSIKSSEQDEEDKKDAELIRFLFHKFFVNTILELVNGQDEIWLLESGMRYQLYRYKSGED